MKATIAVSIATESQDYPALIFKVEVDPTTKALSLTKQLASNLTERAAKLVIPEAFPTKFKRPYH